MIPLVFEYVEIVREQVSISLGWARHIQYGRLCQSSHFDPARPGLGRCAQVQWWRQALVEAGPTKVNLNGESKRTSTLEWGRHLQFGGAPRIQINAPERAVDGADGIQVIAAG